MSMSSGCTPSPASAGTSLPPIMVPRLAKSTGPRPVSISTLTSPGRKKQPTGIRGVPYSAASARCPACQSSGVPTMSSLITMKPSDMAYSVRPPTSMAALAAPDTGSAASGRS
jgi:hypothetical protein